MAASSLYNVAQRVQRCVGGDDDDIVALLQGIVAGRDDRLAIAAHDARHQQPLCRVRSFSGTPMNGKPGATLNSSASTRPPTRRCSVLMFSDSKLFCMARTYMAMDSDVTEAVRRRCPPSSWQRPARRRTRG